MFRIQTLNSIAVQGLERFPRARFEVAGEIGHPDAILLRSARLTSEAVGETVKAVARAGAGVNNIDVAALTARGIPVFNTPGANANAVKELVLAALLLGSRGILDGIHWVNGLQEQDASVMHELVEAEKKRFKGRELRGRRLGVVGLGAIGSRVAEMALGLGMEVLGFDPALSVDAAWQLPNQVQKMENLPALLARCDYLSLHVPLLDATRHLINADALKLMKPDACVLNFARDQIVDVAAMSAALREGALRGYLCDFPEPALRGVPGAICTPHLGASTAESELNCAVMAADQLVDFLVHGNVRNAVNFPSLVLEPGEGFRLAVSNRNVPRMLGQILAVLADANVNVIDMLNKSRDELAYNLLDLASAPSAEMLARIAGIEGVITVRALAPGA